VGLEVQEISVLNVGVRELSRVKNVKGVKYLGKTEDG
jgi:hypothetical protein